MKNPYINPLISLAIVIGLPLSTLALGTLAIAFSSSYDRVCDTDNKCTTTLKFGGWSAIPVQEISAAIGATGTLISAVGSGYLALKNDKKSSELLGKSSLTQNVASEEPSSDLPSGS